MKKSDKWVKWYLVFIIILAVLVSFGAVWHVVSYASGEKTEAVVLESVNKRIKTGARRQTSSKITKVKISYTVDGEKYNEEIQIQGWYRLKEGETVKASYNPKHPDKALIPQQLYSDIKGDIFWGLFVGLQLAVVIYAGKHKKNKDEDNSVEMERIEA